MKRIILFLVLIMLALLIPSTAFGAPKNNIVNGGFEDFENVSSDWETYIDDESLLNTTLEFVKIDENVVLRLGSQNPNYVSIKQSVFLKANTTYEIGAKVMSENIAASGYGGYLRLEDEQGQSPQINGTISEWQDVSFFVTTLGTDIYTSLEIGLGSFLVPNTGTLIVDDVYIIENKNVPNNAGLTIINPDVDIEETQKPIEPTTRINPIFSQKEKLSIILLLFCTVLFMLLITWYSSKARAIYSVESMSKTMTNVYLIVGIVLIVFYKYVVSAMGTDLPSDIGAFIRWSGKLNEHGLRYFYTNTKCNYPCGYMYVLYFIGFIGKAFAVPFNSLEYNLMLKTPVILAEVITAFIAYKIAKKYLGDKNGLIFSFIVLLNPAVLINTSAWGQIDAVFIMFIVLTFYFLQEEKYYFGAAVFAASVLIKAQSILFLPVFGAYYLIIFLRDKDVKINLRVFFISILIAAATFIVLSIPFMGDNGIFWSIKKVGASAGTYDYTSMNAFNFYTLFGGNYSRFADKFMFMTYQTWGYIFIILSSLISVFLVFMNRKKQALFLIAGFMIAAVFTFGHGMHERYILPLPILLFFAYIYLKDRRIINAAILYTVFALFSQMAVLYLFGESFYNTIVILMSIFSMICFGYLIYVVFILLIKSGTVIKGLEKSRPDEIKRKSSEQTKKIIGKINRKPAHKLHKKYERAKIDKIDRILIISMTVVYAVIAFINLGSFKIPDSSWSPVQSNERIVVELEESSDISEIKYYFGLGRTDIDITKSDDGEIFSDISLPSKEENYFVISHKPAYMYRWNFIEAGFKAKYIGLEFGNANIDVREIGFTDTNGNIIPIKNIYSEVNSDVIEVYDEQALIPDVISYKQGMYFDEIYHARTALEHIEHRNPYEITHPPLGKSILSIGIRIFGMNPFGWRFMGTLFGVLMLPLMYIFAKRLMRRTTFAFVATCLLMFDFMHFAQTRMATIDSYSVFFIMLMFLFMFEYYKMNYNRDKLYKTFLPLGLSGVAFGLGAATKWLCLYAGVGLAIIFFYSMIQRFREYYAAKIYMNEDGCRHKEFYTRVVKSYYYKTVMTLIFCIIIFIIIPALIYYLSYTPYMKAESNPYTFKMILENQKYMWNYHSTLDTAASPHPFASRWSTWILNIRPVYLFQGKGYAKDMISSLSTFGNPIIWWALIPSIIIILIAKFYDQDYEGALGFVAVAGLAEFVPWIFISRETYIYHYFASLPFVFLIITMACKFIWDRTKYGKFLVLTFLLAAIGMFIAFYPVITGIPFSRSYVEGLRWLETWPFY